MSAAHADPPSMTAAFPAALGPDVRAVTALLPPLSHGPHWEAHGSVLLPVRLYHPEPAADVPAALTPRQRLVLHCLFAAHHDGYVRQRHAAHVAGADESWAVPFVVRLTGEYVLEIVADIRARLTEALVPGSEARRVYGRFAGEHPEFLSVTERRAVSYWNEYQRWRFPEFAAHPAAAVLELLRAAAVEATGRAWPRQTRVPRGAR
ncbi:hypothetical protein [Actinacidiphila glaucinigra]|uniref:hypothetical protein n=1 Tax=Actinacidiphila glaucinigra TaxID=235986 RepID=UPI003D90B0BA